MERLLVTQPTSLSQEENTVRSVVKSGPIRGGGPLDLLDILQ